MGCPGLQQGAIHREVLITEQRLDLRGGHQLLQETAHHLVIEEALPVLGERGGVPDRIIRASGPQTSGTAGCSAVAPVTATRSESRRTPARARPAAAARAAPMADLLRRRAHRRWD